MATKVISKKELYTNPKYRKYIKKYKQAKKLANFDGRYEFDGDEYDNFFTKDYWKRRKERRALRKKYKSEGMSRGQARVKARLEAREKVPRVPVKEALKRGFNTFKKVTLALPRSAGLGLIALNYRGVATRLWFGWSTDRKQKIEDKWISLGGNPDKLFNAIKSGKDRKAILCGANCKQALVGIKQSDIDEIKGKLEDNINDNFSYPSGLEETATLVAIGGTIVGAIQGTISGIQNNKRNKEALAEEKRVNDEMLKMQTQQQTFEQEQALKMIAQQTDPIAEIQANPDLTPDQKAQAIAEINMALDPEGEGFGQTKPINPLMIGGLFIGVIFAMGFISKMRNRNRNTAPVGA